MYFSITSLEEGINDNYYTNGESATNSLRRNKGVTHIMSKIYRASIILIFLATIILIGSMTHGQKNKNYRQNQKQILLNERLKISPQSQIKNSKLKDQSIVRYRFPDNQNDQKIVIESHGKSSALIKTNQQNIHFPKNTKFTQNKIRSTLRQNNTGGAGTKKAKIDKSSKIR